MEPLLVSTKEGFRAIGVGNTKGYALIASGELEAVKLGGATRIGRPALLRASKIAFMRLHREE